jgi:RNA polymerase sigma-70 factor (ECF subfamily)
MAAAQAGDGEAYQRLLVELVPLLRGLVRSRIADPSAVDDVLQEVLLSIHTARHTYRAERPLLPWVRAIARNATVDWVRRQVRTRALFSDVEPADLRAEPPAPVWEPLPPRLSRAIESLPPAQRQAVLLVKVEGLSVSEAATRAGVTQSALKVRAHRGYRALRELLGAPRR